PAPPDRGAARGRGGLPGRGRLPQAVGRLARDRRHAAMMRSPYQSPKDAPTRRYLRLPPTEIKRKRRRVLLWGAGLLLGYLVYSFVGGDDGLIRVRALQ